MTKRNIGDEIIEGMAEAIEYMKGNVNSAKIHKIGLGLKTDTFPAI